MRHSGFYSDWVWRTTESKQAAAHQSNAGFSQREPAKKANKAATRTGYFAYFALLDNLAQFGALRLRYARAMDRVLSEKGALSRRHADGLVFRDGGSSFL